jgi:hypothetical protein
MTEWTKQLSNNLKKDKEEKLKKDKALVVKRKMIKDHGPTIWNSVIKELTSSCKEIEEEMGKALLAVTIRKNHATIKTSYWGYENICDLSFDSIKDEIGYVSQSGVARIAFPLSVIGGMVQMAESRSGTYSYAISVESFVENMVKAILQKPSHS